ncbi:hypothetical protein [Synechococcus phage BUCT-ZZ01]|nr:hypothetical protein [Synechococcus phage BUCT-ZZ01]
MLETLIAAKQLIEDEKNWCQGVRAQDAEGWMTEPYESSACRFCAIGAIQKVKDCRDNIHIYECSEVQLLDSLVVKNDPSFHAIYQINDTRGHKAVIEFFDKAIQQLKEREVLC